MSIPFKKLELKDWRQFDDIDIELHPTLTIITGANGAGKSTLLNLFSRHFGWHRNYLATPKRNKKTGGYNFFSGLFRRFKKDSAQPTTQTIGKIQYANDVEGNLLVPTNTNIQYDVQIQNQQNVQGVFIPSHRQMPVYKQVANIPITSISPSTAFNNYKSESVQRFSNGTSREGQTYRLKEALISMAMFGEGNNDVEGNSAVLEAYRGFKDVLRVILPETLGFLDISIRVPDVVLVTKSGEFVIDAASGGVNALIDLAWQIHMLSRDNPEFVVAIDEPENHLHPSMQRTLMERLISAFPRVQFIIATHSPFIVSSVKESHVYVLGYNNGNANDTSDDFEKDPSERWVSSTKLDTVNRAGNANEILREVLGVPVTTPDWVHNEVNSIIGRYQNQEFSNQTLSNLRQELAQFGYDEMYPDAVAELVRHHD